MILLPISPKFSRVIFKEFTADITHFMVRKPPDDIQQIEDYIERCRERMAVGSELTFVVLIKEDRDFLGVCAVHGQASPRSQELGIWIKKNAQSKGFGREATHTLVAWIANNLEFEYLVYPVDKRNIPSRRVAESLGGVIFKEGSRKSVSGSVLEEVAYRIDVEAIPNAAPFQVTSQSSNE